MAEQITLKMEAEELRTWMKDKRTKKVLAFLVEKQQELAADLLAGNYRVPNQTLEDLGAWMIAAEAEFKALNLMLHLENWLPYKEKTE